MTRISLTERLCKKPGGKAENAIQYNRTNR